MFKQKIPCISQAETVQEADAVHKVNIERRKLYMASDFSFLLTTGSLSEEKSYGLSK